MTDIRDLSDQVGVHRFKTLCLLADLQSDVADAYREYITSGGRLDGLRQPLADAARVIKELLDSVNTQEN